MTTPRTAAGLADTDRLRESFTFAYAHGGETYPFVEDENCNITGYGHQDKAEFAAAVNRYDTEAGELDPNDCTLWDPSYVGHGWVVIDPDDDERLWVRLDRGKGEPVTSSTPGAIPVTTLWGAR